MYELASAADAALIERSRSGDSVAFGELWKRHHRAGLKAARSIAPTLDPDDLVSESFAKILTQLGRGNGPSNSFRPYLYIVIRSTAADQYRVRNGEVSVDEVDELAEARQESVDSAKVFDISATANAYHSLPVREQEVLWYTVVEGLPPRKASLLIGSSVTATAALAMRARNRLRLAWLAEHAQDPNLAKTCRDIVGTLGAYYKGSLAVDDRERIEEHISGCAACAEIIGEAEKIYARPRGPIAASVLGLSTAGALKYTTATVAPAAAAALIGGTAGKVVLGAIAALAAIALVGGPVLFGGGGQNGTATQGGGPEQVERPSDTPGEEDQDSRETGDGGAEESEPNETNSTADGTMGGQAQAARQPGSSGGASSPGGAGQVEATDGGVTPPGGSSGLPSSPTPTPPEAPVDPVLPAIDDSLPHTLPPIAVSTSGSSPWRLAVRGTDALPGATVRLRITTEPVPGGARYGVIRQTVAGSTGYWAFANVGGVTPLNVTVEAQQLTDSAASPWVTVVSGASYAISIASPTPGDFNGVTAWYAHGWPGASWALREVGADWPRSAGRFSAGGGAAVPVPSDVLAGQSKEYEVGYWIEGRFEASGERLRVTG